MIALAFVALVWVSFESRVSAQFAERDPNKPMSRLPDYKRSWEMGWAPDWVLKSVEEGWIDEFASGYVMTWERQEGKLRRVRTDGFTFDWEFWWGHEKVYDGDKLVARGPIEISRDGHPLWRRMVNLGRVYPADPMKDEILSYDLEMFRDARVICTYRSKLNFGIDPKTLQLERVPDDTQLISGEGCPSVELLRRGYTP